MICRRCLLRLSARRNATLSSSRSFTQSTKLAAQEVSANTTTATKPRPHDTPAATSTSAAQPFSAGSIPGIEPEALKSHGKKEKEKVKSSVQAGTVLKGLNFLKNAQDPVALEDEQYPEWLWSALERQGEREKGESVEGDLFGRLSLSISERGVRGARANVCDSEVKEATKNSRKGSAEAGEVTAITSGVE
jgi:large subunit ribosomal protein L54